MNRRILLHSGSFTSASLIFTKIIWQKDQPALYRHTGKLNNDSSRLHYALSVLHKTIREFQHAKSSERKLVLTVQFRIDREREKNPPIAVFTYEIFSSEIIKTEMILSEEVKVYEVKAKLVTCSGDLQMHTGLEEELVLLVKPGLSVTVAAEQEIYLPFQGNHAGDEEF